MRLHPSPDACGLCKQPCVQLQMIQCLQGAAVVGMSGGLLGDWLHVSRSWSLANVRRLMQGLASFGAPARCLALVSSKRLSTACYTTLLMLYNPVCWQMPPALSAWLLMPKSGSCADASHGMRKRCTKVMQEHAQNVKSLSSNLNKHNGNVKSQAAGCRVKLRETGHK